MVDRETRALLDAINGWRQTHTHQPDFQSVDSLLKQVENDVQKDGDQGLEATPGQQAAQAAGTDASSSGGGSPLAALASAISGGDKGSPPALASGATKDQARAAMGGADSARGSSTSPFMDRMKRRAATAQKGA